MCCIESGQAYRKSFFIELEGINKQDKVLRTGMAHRHHRNTDSKLLNSFGGSTKVM